MAEVTSIIDGLALRRTHHADMSSYQGGEDVQLLVARRNLETSSRDLKALFRTYSFNQKDDERTSTAVACSLVKAVPFGELCVSVFVPQDYYLRDKAIMYCRAYLYICSNGNTMEAEASLTQLLYDCKNAIEERRSKKSSW